MRKSTSQLDERVRIRGAATTGYGRYPTGDFNGADLVINEITAQATAAAEADPGVEAVLSTPCFPVKVAHGHVPELMASGIDFLWNARSSRRSARFRTGRPRD